jgi:hypothetical protein
MIDLAIPAFGFLCAVVGGLFLVGCFVRVDSPGFIERAAGDEQKIHKLRSLQAAWGKLGKLRQFVASSSGYLIMAVGLLLIWRKPELAGYSWVVPAAYALNVIALLRVRRHALLTLDKESPGGAEVLKVIKQNIRACITFSVVFVLLAAAI